MPVKPGSRITLQYCSCCTTIVESYQLLQSWWSTTGIYKWNCCTTDKNRAKVEQCSTLTTAISESCKHCCACLHDSWIVLYDCWATNLRVVQLHNCPRFMNGTTLLQQELQAGAQLIRESQWQKRASRTTRFTNSTANKIPAKVEHCSTHATAIAVVQQRSAHNFHGSVILQLTQLSCNKESCDSWTGLKVNNIRYHINYYTPTVQLA